MTGKGGVIDKTRMVDDIYKSCCCIARVLYINTVLSSAYVDHGHRTQYTFSAIINKAENNSFSSRRYLTERINLWAKNVPILPRQSICDVVRANISYA